MKPKLNFIENIAYRWGRTRGVYELGLQQIMKQFPSVGDSSAWLHPTLWGKALMTGSKPRTKGQFVSYFQSWVYICTKLNAQSVASAPFHLYVSKKKKGQKFKTIDTIPIRKSVYNHLKKSAYLEPWMTKAAEVDEVTDHVFLDLMKNVNDFMNRRDLYEITSMFADLTGEAYWYLPNMKIEGQAIPIEIWPIPSPYINPIPGETLKEFIKGYLYKRGRNEVELSIDEVVQFPYPNPKNQYIGFSCVEGVSSAVFVQSEMYAFEEALFKNKGRVGGIISMEESISEAEKTRLQTKFQQKYAGSRNAGKDLVLPKGMKYNKDSMTPEEMSFIEGRKLIREEITAAWDIPFSQFDPSANKATTQQGEYKHAKYGILPRCERIAQKINEKILPRFSDQLFCAFEDIVPKDRETLLKEHTELSKANIMTINEVREERGLDGVQWGDSAWMDSRLIPVKDGEPIKAEEETEKFLEKFTEKVKQMWTELDG